MIMKDDKDPSGSWIRIGMLGLVGRGPETVLVRWWPDLGTSHALSDGACLADGCSHLGKGQKTEETSRCVRLRLAGGSAQLTVEQPTHKHAFLVSVSAKKNGSGFGVSGILFESFLS